MAKGDEPNWFCAICGTENSADIPSRESMLCGSCSSTWRFRATVLSVTNSISGSANPLSVLEPDWSIQGIGLSDHPPVSSTLATKYKFTNTHFHAYPILDIRRPPQELLGTANFIICCDVLEHVPPPVETALTGLRSILNDSFGFAVISVPTMNRPETDEYYPGLVDWKSEEDGSVIWSDDRGNKHCDHNPEYHGGGGQTLTFREWSMTDLSERLLCAGFSRVEPHAIDDRLGVPALGNAGMVIAWS